MRTKTVEIGGTDSSYSPPKGGKKNYIRLSHRANTYGYTLYIPLKSSVIDDIIKYYSLQDTSKGTYFPFDEEEGRTHHEEQFDVHFSFFENELKIEVKTTSDRNIFPAIPYTSINKISCEGDFNKGGEILYFLV